MEEEFYSVIKLVSGEEIFSLVLVDDNDGDPIIILQNPVTMKTMSGPNGMPYLVIKNWIQIVDDDMFFIKLDKVITMTEIKDRKLIELYEYYLKEETVEIYKPQGKVSLNSQMGFVDTVNSARKKLEDLFENNS